MSGGTDNVKTISLQRDGKILVSGDSRFVSGEPHQSARQIQCGRLPDESFNPALPAGAVIEAILIQVDDGILISGIFTFSVDASIHLQYNQAERRRQL